MTDALEIRDVHSADDLRAVENLQRAVWGFSDLDVIPSTYFRGVLASGGLLLGAFQNGRMAGFAFSYPGYRHGRVEMHSDMVGVEAEYRDRGTGYQLKLAQRNRCLSMGIHHMTWTFDPLRARNAHFNFNKLGALSDSYRLDFYGKSTSSHLHTDGTDRLWITWPLRREPGPRNPRSEPLRIAIPPDIDALSESDRRHWRLVTRERLAKAVGSGYVFTGFRANEYILEKGPIETFL